MRILFGQVGFMHILMILDDAILMKRKCFQLVRVDFDQIIVVIDFLIRDV